MESPVCADTAFKLIQQSVKPDMLIIDRGAKRRRLGCRAHPMPVHSLTESGQRPKPYHQDQRCNGDLHATSTVRNMPISM
jgi:hypothetical protein